MILSEIKSKYLSLEDAIYKRETFRTKNIRVGLCHGTFDFVPLGHLRHFARSKE